MTKKRDKQGGEQKETPHDVLVNAMLKHSGKTFTVKSVPDKKVVKEMDKKQKELKKFREGLTVGDKVVTIGGIHGKILEVAESTILIATESGKLRLDKSAVTNGETGQQQLGQR